MSRLGARAARTTPVTPRPSVITPVNYAKAVGNAELLAEDRQLNEEAVARPEPTYPAFMIVRAPGGYVLVEYALPTSIADVHVVKRYEPDLRGMAIERLLRRLDAEHDV